MLRPGNATSITIVAAMFSSWLAISNHCALGTTLPEKVAVAQASENECPFHAKQAPPGKQKPESNTSPCCKVLRAIAVSPAKTAARTIVDLASIDAVFTEFVGLTPPKILFLSPALDTGPPGSSVVSQLIRSVPAHAPPVLA